MHDIQTVGIIGAGKLGVTVAQLALAAGYTVNIAGSGDPKNIELSVKIITPGATAVTAERAASESDIVVLALPLGKFRSLSPKWFDGKFVIDAMNHWYEVDGPLEDTIPDNHTTSEEVQAFLHNSVVVKALNHMGYHHLRDEAKPKGVANRKAIAIAGDNDEAVRHVSDFVDSIGFDPLLIGGLKNTHALEAGGSAFGANMSYDELHRAISA